MGERIRSYLEARGYEVVSPGMSTTLALWKEEYVAALNRFRPEFLHAYPSAALQLAEFLDRAGQKLGCGLTALLCGSTRLTIPQNRLLERVFQCYVYRWYGHSERVVLVGEGESSELFHFLPRTDMSSSGRRVPMG